VHQASGFSGLAYAIVLGKRNGPQGKHHNLANVFLGTALLWLGWFGFNGASAIGATPRAAMSGFVTTIAASSGALAWVLVDALRTKKLSGVGFCSGALAGLVGITPASGFVAPWASIVIGIVTAVVCNLGCMMKEVLGFDDSLDAFGSCY
jgi:Amt family ammonium transporter